MKVLAQLNKNAFSFDKDAPFVVDKIREIEIPDEEAKGKNPEALLELVFKYGQNEIQWRPAKRSLSVGDRVDLHGVTYEVAKEGWINVCVPAHLRDKLCFDCPGSMCQCNPYA